MAAASVPLRHTNPLPLRAAARWATTTATLFATRGWRLRCSSNCRHCKQATVCQSAAPTNVRGPAAELSRCASAGARRTAQSTHRRSSLRGAGAKVACQSAHAVASHVLQPSGPLAARPVTPLRSSEPARPAAEMVPIGRRLAAALALALLAAMLLAAPAAAEKCGWPADNRTCADADACCNKYVRCLILDAWSQW